MQIVDAIKKTGRFSSNLKVIFMVVFGLQLILLSILFLLIYNLYQNKIRLNISHETNLKSYLLADELRQSSDDLSRMARAYVATGNAEYEREYWTVLAIRNGEEPRPVDYHRIYWDFVSANGEKPRADGQRIALMTLMEKEGFTGDELAKLKEAQDNSDYLVKAETIAMNAVKGLFDDGAGNYTAKKAPDFVLANDLMNNKEYFSAKAKIMRPIDEFYVMFEGRTKGEVDKSLQASEVLFRWIFVLAIIIFILSVFFIYAIRRQIILREKAEKDILKINTDLNKMVEEKTKDLSAKVSQYEEINKLMVGREMRIMELKEELAKANSKNQKEVAPTNTNNTGTV